MAIDGFITSCCWFSTCLLLGLIWRTLLKLSAVWKCQTPRIRQLRYLPERDFRCCHETPRLNCTPESESNLKWLFKTVVHVLLIWLRWHRSKWSFKCCPSCHENGYTPSIKKCSCPVLSQITWARVEFYFTVYIFPRDDIYSQNARKSLLFKTKPPTVYYILPRWCSVNFQDVRWYQQGNIRSLALTNERLDVPYLHWGCVIAVKSFQILLSLCFRRRTENSRVRQCWKGSCQGAISSFNTRWHRPKCQQWSL